MKKLIVMCAAVALAFTASAASCTWNTGTLIKAPSDDGSFGSANAGSGTLSLYVWIVDQATYNSTSLDDIASKDVSTATQSKTGGSGSTGVKVSTTHDQGTGVGQWQTDQNNPIYALILTKYKSGDVEGYIANKATGNINGSGTGGTISNLAKNMGGGSGTAISGWSGIGGDVPEPTSGILMLVGLGALALRRRKA